MLKPAVVLNVHSCKAHTSVAGPQRLTGTTTSKQELPRECTMVLVLGFAITHQPL
jgi:hypothetical protein